MNRRKFIAWSTPIMSTVMLPKHATASVGYGEYECTEEFFIETVNIGTITTQRDPNNANIILSGSGSTTSLMMFPEEIQEYEIDYSLSNFPSGVDVSVTVPDYTSNSKEIAFTVTVSYNNYDLCAPQLSVIPTINFICTPMLQDIGACVSSEVFSTQVMFNPDGGGLNCT